MGKYYRYHLFLKKHHTRGYYLMSRLCRYVFSKIFECIFPLLKKNPDVLKFDVWDESDKTRLNTRFLTPMINKCFRPNKIVYIDIEKKLIKQAKKIIPRSSAKRYLVNGDITRLPFKKMAFDLVIDFSTTDHLNEIEFDRTLSHVYRVLKKNGIYIIYHLNKDYADIDEWNSAYSSDMIPSYPRSIDEIKKKLTSHGFKILFHKFLWSFFFDKRLLWFYILDRHRFLFQIIPAAIKYNFFNLRNFNLFFVVVAMKSN